MKKTLVLCAVCAAMTMSASAEKTTSNEAVQTSSASVSETQQLPMKIITNCPNIRIKVTKCVASGKTVMLTFKMTNVSGNDAENVYVIKYRDAGNVYDDQGNIYDDLSLKYANNDFRTYYFPSGFNFTLLADVPVTFTLKIEGVSTSAEYLARVDLQCNHSGLGLKTETPITLRNIPINRE